MAEPKLLRTCDLDPDEIEVVDRLRPVSTDGVASLVASIEETGIVKDAVDVREIRRTGEDTALRLMAGGHRVEACRQLGRTVPAKVWSCTGDWARLIEIDDNLANNDLSALDMAVFLAERRRVHQMIHPETREHFAGAAARWMQRNPSSAAFAKTIAEARGITERQVRKIASAGDVLSSEDVAQLRLSSKMTKRPITLADLQALAKLPGDEARRKAIWTFCNATTLKNVRAAVAYNKPAESAPKDPVEAALSELKAKWCRAPKEAQRRFVRELAAELSILLDEEGGNA